MFIRRLARDDNGATAIEYALIATIIAIASIAAFRTVGLEVIATFEVIGDALGLV